MMGGNQSSVNIDRVGLIYGIVAFSVRDMIEQG